MISHYLAYFPKSDKGVVIDCFAQSKKWCEGLQVDHRVQMVEVQSRHYYIYEPVQLLDFCMVVPCFFFTEAGILKAKCLVMTFGSTHMGMS